MSIGKRLHKIPCCNNKTKDKLSQCAYIKRNMDMLVGVFEIHSILQSVKSKISSTHSHEDVCLQLGSIRVVVIFDSKHGVQSQKRAVNNENPKGFH